jgi:hypothetical protein
LLSPPEASVVLAIVTPGFVPSDVLFEAVVIVPAVKSEYTVTTALSDVVEQAAIPLVTTTE